MLKVLLIFVLGVLLATYVPSVPASIRKVL